MNRMRLAFHLCVCVVALLGLGPSLVWAQEPPAQSKEVKLDASKDYLLGLSTSTSQDAVGGDGRKQSWSPLWAFRWGRFRFATGGAAALLSLGRDTVDAGVSTSLLQDDRWSLSSSLRWDGGRKSEDPLLIGLPEVRSTLRGRVNLGYRFTPRWSVGLTASQDLLGRDGGLQMSSGLRYHHPVSRSTYWDAGVGVQWGSATYMQTHYGITPAVAQASGRSAYGLSSGWERVSLSWGMASALNERWVVFGGLGWSGMHGGARFSPLVGQRDAWSASFGLAYRCCN